MFQRASFQDDGGVRQSANESGRSPTPLTDRLRAAGLAAELDGMEPHERLFVMREFVDSADSEDLAGEIIEVLRFASDNFEAAKPAQFEMSMLFFEAMLKDGERGGPTNLAVLPALDELVAENRATGAHRAELFFMALRGSPFFTTEPIFANRAVHRRAAELGLLDDEIAREALNSIGNNMRTLSEENRHEDAVRAGADTLAELDAAGVGASDWVFLMAYGEALALAGMGEQSDYAFKRAFDYLEGLDKSADMDPLLLRRALGSRLENMKLVANQWAYFLNIQGRFADAEEPGRYAAEWAEKIDGRDDISTQKSRYNFAVALLGQGKAAEALPYFEEALPLQRAEELDGGWRPASSIKKDTVLLLTTLARARVQVPGREADGLDAAVEAADAVRALRDERLRGSGKDEAGDPGAAALAQAVARGERRDPLSPAYDMVLLSGWATRAGKADNIDVAFRAAQDLTLNEAGSAITQAAARELAGEGELGQLVRRRQDVAAQIVSVNGDYRTASTGTDAARLAALAEQLSQLGDELAEIDKRLDTQFPEYGDLVAPRSVDTAAVSGALSEDEALVMMLPSEGHHYVFAITREAATWYRAEDSGAQIEALVDRLRCRMDEATCSGEDYEAAIAAEDGSGEQPVDAFYPRYDQAAAYRLYELLLQPIETVLAGKSVVYTVAAGPISGLPLAALVTAPPTGENAQSGDPEVLRAAPWLGARHAFVTLPSVSAITLPRAQQRTRTSGMVGYGAPLLGGVSPATARGGSGSERRRGSGGALRASTFFEGSDGAFKVDPAKLRLLAPLPGTERELAMMARSLAGGDVRLRMGSDATETAVKQDASLANAEVVVFATHGLLPGEMGQTAEPGLVLTPPDAGSVLDDGLLTASEAAELSLAARWLILSACNTATPGGGQGAEALSGLARAFIYAGADSLLASHWRVSDDASAALTVQTIRAGQSGLTQAEALQAAQNAVRTGTGIDGQPLEDWASHWAHPSAWAPFTLISDHNR